MISCAEAVRQLWEVVQDEPLATDRSRIEEHLTLCRRCCGEMEFVIEMNRFMASVEESPLPPAVESRLEFALEQMQPEGIT
jgi:predicted anti-sigma-YlaC factor YlaD